MEHEYFKETTEKNPPFYRFKIYYWLFITGLFWKKYILRWIIANILSSE